MRTPAARASALALVILAAALGLLLPSLRALLGSGPRWRHVVLWGLPAVAGIAGLMIDPGRPAIPKRPATDALRRRTVAIAPWAGAAVLVDWLFLAFGQFTGRVTFTYGDQALMEHPLRPLLWALPICLVIGLLGWERPLRRSIYLGWSGALPDPLALGLSCVVGLVLSLPAILPRFAAADPPFVPAALVVVLAREVSCALIFVAGGGLAAAGLYRGAILYLDLFVINDWLALPFPAYNYVSSDPLFYAVRAGAALLSLACIAVGARRALAAGRSAEDAA